MAYQSNITVILAKNTISAYRPGLLTIRTHGSKHDVYTQALLAHEMVHMVFSDGDMRIALSRNSYEATMVLLLNKMHELFGEHSTILDLFYLNSNAYNVVEARYDENTIRNLGTILGIRECAANNHFIHDQLEQKSQHLLEAYMPIVITDLGISAQAVYFLERMADYLNGIENGVYSHGVKGFEEIFRYVEMKTAGVGDDVLSLYGPIVEAYSS